MERNIKGVDNAAPVSQKAAAALYAAGIRFSGRYLVPTYGGTNWKALTEAEAEGILAAGLALLLIWEMDAERPKGGAKAGAQDGARARQLAQDMGVPDGTAIYFAVDYCPADGEYDTIAEYLRAAAAACGGYTVGVYGSYYVVEAMAKRNACKKFWQCVAWSNGRVSDKAATYQYQWQGGAEARAITAKCGFAVDMNACSDMGDAGLWQPKSVMEYDDGEGGKIYVSTPATQPAPWYADAMEWAEREGLIRDGRPNDYVTRAELATVLFRKFGPVDEKTESGLLSDD